MSTPEKRRKTPDGHVGSDALLAISFMGQPSIHEMLEEVGPILGNINSTIFVDDELTLLQEMKPHFKRSAGVNLRES